MKKTKKLSPATREDFLQIFSKIDQMLVKQSQRMGVTVIGGVSVIFLEIRERTTLDIDIANNQDAASFQKICSSLGMHVDIVTVVSTVDLNHAPKVVIFQGRKLTVSSITAEDLVKLKLERFYKQDPEDIYAIIEKIQLSYQDFKSLVEDMLPDFIGNHRVLLLSALIVVERMYPHQTEEFKKLLY